MNSFNLTSCGKHFICLSILNDSFAGYSNLGCRSLPFMTSNTSFQPLLSCTVHESISLRRLKGLLYKIHYLPYKMLPRQQPLKSKRVGKVERGLGWVKEAERGVRRPVQESHQCLTGLKKNRELGCRLSGSAGCPETT